MARAGRRIALLTLDANMLRDDEWAPFNYAIRRIQAAVLADPELRDAEVTLFEAFSPDALETMAADVERFDPDLIGASTYLWSFPTFVEIARRLKRARPDRTVVFGGPSARPAMFGLEPYADAVSAVDALVVRDGEEVFCDIARLGDRTAPSLLGVQGLAVSTPNGWVDTPPRTADTPLDELPSPYQMGLVPKNVTAHIETFRGCPLSCAFCEWGVADRPSRVYSTEYLVREFETLREMKALGGFLVDAALNLNARAFKNLVAAERETHYFRDHHFSCEIYPTHLRDEHLQFLSEVNVHHIGVGLQSYNKEVLARINRPFDEKKFERGLADLSKVTSATCEVIFGLPGDNPESFQRTLDRLMEQPCNFLVYHCLVLPDGLMTRAPAGSNMVFDPYSLKMISCWGWSEKDFREQIEKLDLMVERYNGRRGEFFWQLPERQSSSGPRQHGSAPPPRRDSRPAAGV
jgi:radical SAM superfamily enzyme YgiQ (UPF0313 family)